MENKKLLKYLLKDLGELEEMFAEKDRNNFDDLEMEFIQNRVAGAKKLVQMYLEHESVIKAETQNDSISGQKPEMQPIDFSGGKTGIWVEEINRETEIVEKKPEITVKMHVPGVVVAESVAEVTVSKKNQEIEVEKEFIEPVVEPVTKKFENEFDNQELTGITVVEIREKPVEEVQKQDEKMSSVAVQQELQLEEDESIDIQNKRLGDLFSKEKSVNDIMSEENLKLGQKLSNMPVTSLHAAIGINDRFQYIRELFEGSVDNFVKTVADLDSMNDIKDAVSYLQTNFKWKKNETSLKFVNLIKRRFPHE